MDFVVEQVWLRFEPRLDVLCDRSFGWHKAKLPGVESRSLLASRGDNLRSPHSTLLRRNFPVRNAEPRAGSLAVGAMALDHIYFHVVPKIVAVIPDRLVTDRPETNGAIRPRACVPRLLALSDAADSVG